MPHDSPTLDALEVWAPTYPRRVTRSQVWAENRLDAITELRHAQDRGGSPFVSVYSFPDGHTKDGNLPEIDTLFIDFDFEDGDYRPGSGNVSAWRRDISHLTVRARKVAQAILDNDPDPWRAALSGHKGIHLFLDFEPLPTDLGTFDQYVAGLNEYAESLVEMLSEESGMKTLDLYVDVTSSDLGRLCRVPNTLHEGATESFGEQRYCVPITIEEMAELTPDLYLERTRAQRPVEVSRQPSQHASEVISRHVRMSSGTTGNAVSRGRSSSDWSRVDEYKEQSEDGISLEDIKFLTSDRPCVWRFYERDDKYRHGYESHYMEMFCIQELLEQSVPIETIKDFLDSAPEYDERYSEERIKQIIARDYNRFRLDTVQQNAPEFCGFEDCAACQQVLQES